MLALFQFKREFSLAFFTYFEEKSLDPTILTVHQLVNGFPHLGKPLNAQFSFEGDDNPFLPHRYVRKRADECTSGYGEMHEGEEEKRTVEGITAWGND